MIDNKKVLVVIPARGGSKGLPGKNIKPLLGKPLVAWPISAALSSKYVDQIVVSTDDELIAEAAKAAGATVPFMRPKHLAADSSPSSDAILHALSFCEKESKYDYIVLLEATSPLTETEDIDRALLLLHESEHTAIVGISLVEDSHPEFCVKTLPSGKIEKYFGGDFETPKRRQDIDDAYCFDGSLYISDVETYKNKKNFYHGNTMGYLSDSWKRYEVDTLIDFLFIETILKNIELVRR
ncbi:acylneuraminate cytidylyltransferase family protein [Vibrio methylphosphonaticus]|uniref:acylneuraminate cytidylyltransferase family protein n=1 Tax=Vibrio methylphosphonaticus TaxID=2946866 RepID=UPI00202A561F|nr:acylneuraminate cytidylyltransferase family protein [Vibrio methylphosphonaticus]MCL9775535.1 acylneuraminate cytidylyltransferase family protein [Vibrio methylphosphonaticus]